MSFVDELQIRQVPPPPPKPGKGGLPLDNFLYGAGLTLLVGSQLLSKSAPAFAGEVSKNVIGPEVAIGAQRFKFKPTLAALMIAPAPFGFVPPTEYGLRPNYLEPLNRSLGSPLPESHLFATEKDYSDSVRFALFQEHVRAEITTVRREAFYTPYPDLIPALVAARSPAGRAYFYDPGGVAAELERVIVSRSSTEELALRIKAQEIVSRRYIDRPPEREREPYRVYLESDLQDNLARLYPKRGNVARPALILGGSGTIVSGLLVNASRPLDSPSPSVLVEAAHALATGPVVNLVAERADP